MCGRRDFGREGAAALVSAQNFLASSLLPVGVAPCFIEFAGRSEDLWINVLCEKDMEDTLAEQLANDVAQRLRLGLPAHPE